MLRHNNEITALKQSLQNALAEVSERKAKSADVKRHARSKLEEAARTFAGRLNSVEAELRATQDKLRMAERAKGTSAKELEANLAQTMSVERARLTAQLAAHGSLLINVLPLVLVSVHCTLSSSSTKLRSSSSASAVSSLTHSSHRCRPR